MNLCMNDNYTVENIPVASYIIDYLTRSSKPGQYEYEGDQKKIQEIINTEYNVFQLNINGIRKK